MSPPSPDPSLGPLTLLPAPAPKPDPNPKQPPTTNQVYEEISPAVCGVLQGQYVCVMAYGQTGAGKTYTMQARTS